MSANPSSATQMAIRPMREHDVIAVSQIEARAYEFPWALGIFTDCLRAGYCSWTLTVDAEIVGYGILAVAADEAHLLNLCVDPDFRQRGYARALLAHLLELSRSHRVTIMFLEVRPSNPAAIGLYESMGFRRVAVRRNYYPAQDGREDAVVMSFRLDEPDAGSTVESPANPG